MGGLSISSGVINQRGTPALYSDTLVNRPVFGYEGRIFFNTSSPYGIYRDTGSSWVLIGGVTTGYAQMISIVKPSTGVVAGALDLSADAPANAPVYAVYLDGVQMGPVPSFDHNTGIMTGFDDPLPASTIEILMAFI